MYIYCEPFMFDLHQRIYLIDDDSAITEVATTTLDELGIAIITMCDKYNVTEVKLRMPLDEFSEALVETIYDTNLALYGKNIINVEVI